MSFIAHLVEAERDDRLNRSIDRKIGHARSRNEANLEDVYYYSDREIDRNHLMHFADCSFIDKAESVLTGKCRKARRSMV